jgi:hypothetical protein
VNCKQVWEKYSHLDPMLSDRTWLGESAVHSCMHDLWMAVKQEAAKGWPTTVDPQIAKYLTKLSKDLQSGNMSPADQIGAAGELARLCRDRCGTCFCGCHISQVMTVPAKSSHPVEIPEACLEAARLNAEAVKNLGESQEGCQNG